MSKKNNKKIIARKHAHDLKLEKEAQEKLKKQQEKAQRKKERQLAATGVVKTKRKGLRIRKGVRVKGIKVVDADSKKAVLNLLKQEQAEKLMEVDDAPAAAAAAAAADGSSKKKAKKRSKVKLVTKTMTGTTSKKAAAGAAAMED
ncbi:hypothetical protein OEZ85_013068 [Tetradesmus obliquus]|uniref:Ribosomal RNA-processing protein 14/surfeit locus protein 6 C-terminal domain-containing protein n=1 Tax=Tetradesmus obliquus TaxID=3088 RepID=A0ABY8U4K5_TETOB|nr:hypothetical protein OEZ85_013068 [Tetradesmus obliquus]